MRLVVKKFGDGFWWILGDEEYGPYGPYNTKAEAEDDKRGIIRCLKEVEKSAKRSKTKKY